MRVELTLPALERLIGGETEIEVHLRQQIVDEFSRKHLKSLMNDEALKRISAEWTRQLKEEVNAQLKDLVAEKQEGAESRVASEAYWSLKGAVEKAAQKAVDEALAKIVEHQKRYWGDEVRIAVKKAMDRQIEKEIEAGIQARLKAAQSLGASD